MVAVVARVIAVARSTCSERRSRLLHRLLHQDPDGSWTWRVRGAKVPATRTTDVCLPIEPGGRRALLSGLPGWRCTVGCVRLRAPCPGVPGLWESVRPRLLENGACRAGAGSGNPMKYQRRRRADLSGRMLRGDLREVDWRDAKLVGADLSGALLYGADLSNSDLTGALLVGADLYGATLCGAVLRDANLHDAKIRAVDLNDARPHRGRPQRCPAEPGWPARRPTGPARGQAGGGESEPCQSEPCADGAC